MDVDRLLKKKINVASSRADDDLCEETVGEAPGHHQLNQALKLEIWQQLEQSEFLKVS